MLAGFPTVFEDVEFHASVFTHTRDTNDDTYHIVPNTTFSMSITVDDVSNLWLSEGQDNVFRCHGSIDLFSIPD